MGVVDEKRTFVRALEGTYGELKEELFSQPRIYHTRDMRREDGPQNFGKQVINPQSVRIAVDRDARRRVRSGRTRPEARPNEQCRLLRRARGTTSRRPESRLAGARRADRGDGCVHQHFSDDRDDETIVLIVKANRCLSSCTSFSRRWSSIRGKNPYRATKPMRRRTRFEYGTEGGIRQELSMNKQTGFVDATERQRARSEAKRRDRQFLCEALEASRQFRQEYRNGANVVKSREMPWREPPTASTNASRQSSLR